MERDELDVLLGHLVSQGGSDLHVKVGAAPRIRILGALERLAHSETAVSNDLVGLVRSIMDEQTFERFERDRDADFAYSCAHGRFRVNGFHQRGAIGLVFRAVNNASQSISDLGLPGAVRLLADEARGLVLVTGPTGSGKTTTLSAMIDHINQTRECHIVTIEDPIEFIHRDERASIDQREVGRDTKSFVSALRSALRQDPDVILVGEMRDEETVATALAAAETGHLVLSTLHTTDSVETINRVVDFFPRDHQLAVRSSLASVLRGTVCQRLIRSVDNHGRVPATEIMIVNGRIRQMIIDPARTSQITEVITDGSHYGMQTFDQCLAQLISDGRVDAGSALEAASNPHDLRVMLQRSGIPLALTAS